MPPFAAEISNSYLKYLAFPESHPASFSYKDWQFTAEGFERLRPLGEVYNATNPNRKAFRDRGGKLILYHGWADPAIPPHGTLAYYQAVQDTMGGHALVQLFARLFMLPGVYHCQGGTGPSRMGWLTPIVAWVEQDTPPTKIIASQTADDSASGGFSNPTERSTSSNATIVRTRPIFPYPMQARYSGAISERPRLNRIIWVTGAMCFDLLSNPDCNWQSFSTSTSAFVSTNIHIELAKLQCEQGARYSYREAQNNLEKLNCHRCSAK